MEVVLSSPGKPAHGLSYSRLRNILRNAISVYVDEVVAEEHDEAIAHAELLREFDMTEVDYQTIMANMVPMSLHYISADMGKSWTSQWLTSDEAYDHRVSGLLCVLAEDRENSGGDS